MFTAGANIGNITQTAIQRALNVRNDMINAQTFYAWLSAQSDADMTGLGFSVGDLSFMRSMAADLNAFANIYHGQAPGGSYVLPYPFVNSSTQIVGVQ